MSCSCWGGEVSSESAESLSSLGQCMGQKLVAPRLIGRTTAHKSLKRIWDLLMDDESRIIGVHGMVGVGKTAIMQNVYNQLLETQRNQYDMVIWVNANRNTEKFLKRVDSLEFVNQRNHYRSFLWNGCKSAAEALKHRKRFVFILDDLSEVFSFDDVGLTKPSKENECKLVFTTRSLDVCKEMECKEDCIVKVELLSEKEALELFWDRVDVKVNPTPRMTEIADVIVKECSRLPLAIVLVGGKFKRENEFGWTKLLLEMKNSDYGILDFAGDGLSLYSKLSDNRFFSLEDILHLCALYPKDWKILTKELIEYIHMLALDRITDDTAEEMVMALKSNAYMGSVEVDFEDYHEWGEGVQIHSLYRDFALMGAHSKMSKCGLMLKELPKEVKWVGHLTLASFMCNNIRTISISPKCPKLSALFLNKNPDLCTISHNFFVHLTGLRILDLRDNYKMETLPDSISDLVNLQALRLSRCRSLKRVPSIAKLLHMEILELDETAIKELPHGIEMLVELKVLKLHSLRLREPISRDYLSMLNSLPHLELHL